LILEKSTPSPTDPVQTPSDAPCIRAGAAARRRDRRRPDPERGHRRDHAAGWDRRL